MNYIIEGETYESRLCSLYSDTISRGTLNSCDTPFDLLSTLLASNFCRLLVRVDLPVIFHYDEGRVGRHGGLKINTP